MVEYQRYPVGKAPNPEGCFDDLIELEMARAHPDRREQLAAKSTRRL
ncbi:MAG: hypothetical protein ACLTBV_16780 [Enterocloster bolteae]